MGTLAECLPRIYAAMCDDEQFACSDVIFRLNRTGSYRTAILYIEKQYITLKLQDLRYLINMLYIVHNQLNSYMAALPDLVIYVIPTLTSDTYVEPTSTARRLILYPNCKKSSKQ